jgi:hypothetical protein
VFTAHMGFHMTLHYFGKNKLLSLQVKNRCRTKGQKACGPTKERKTCNWYDENVEENYESWKKPKKPIENNKTNINKNMTQLTYEVW